VKTCWTLRLEKFVSWSIRWDLTVARFRIRVVVYYGPRRRQRPISLTTINVGEPTPSKQKAKQRAYNSRSEVKKHRREWAKTYQKSPEVKERARERVRLFMRKWYPKMYSLALSTVASHPMNGTLHDLGLPECKFQDDSCSGRLNIDHINGDGEKERATKQAITFYREIVAGERKTDDLRVLCQSHNEREPNPNPKL
jgi:hypothetical protein